MYMRIFNTSSRLGQYHSLTQVLTQYQYQFQYQKCSIPIPKISSIEFPAVFFGIPVECRGCVYGSACQKFWQSQCTPLQGILSESPRFSKFHLYTLRVARGWNASEQNHTDMGELSEERFQQWFSRSFCPKHWICYRRVILI